MTPMVSAPTTYTSTPRATLRLCATSRSAPIYVNTPTPSREYVIVKRAAYTRYPADIDAYNDAKDDYIKRIEKVALAWYQKRG